MKKIFILILLLSLTACTSKFDGSRTGNDSQLIMDFRVLNTTDYQLLKLEQGDVIDVDIVSNSGQINIEAKKDDDEPIYKGESVPTSSFQIEISESGTYKFSVTGRKAKGSVSFIKQTPESDITQERSSQIESIDDTSSEGNAELESQSKSVPSVKSTSEAEPAINPGVSQEHEEAAGEVIGNPDPDDFQGDDFFIYQKIVCINATNIDWINEMALTEGELLGEIKRTGITESHTDWDATILSVGTKIYQHAERNDVLIAIKGDTKVPYMKMIEG